jgi:hypothetical protein
MSRPAAVTPLVESILIGLRESPWARASSLVNFSSFVFQLCFSLFPSACPFFLGLRPARRTRWTASPPWSVSRYRRVPAGLSLVMVISSKLSCGYHAGPQVANSSWIDALPTTPTRGWGDKPGQHLQSREKNNSYASPVTWGPGDLGIVNGNLPSVRRHHIFGGGRQAMTGRRRRIHGTKTLGPALAGL